VTCESCIALARSPDIVKSRALHQLVCKIDAFNICPGHSDEKFVKMATNRGGNFHANSGGVSAYLDKNGTYHLNGHIHTVKQCNLEIAIFLLIISSAQSAQTIETI